MRCNPVAKRFSRFQNRKKGKARCNERRKNLFESKKFVVFLPQNQDLDFPMSTTRKIRTALVSVYYKDGLEELLRALHQSGVSFLSTGGTHQFIASLGLPCRLVEDLTSYPSILGGRVKTLHPRIFGGILGRRSNKNDEMQMREYDIPEIDLVIVNLYPFSQTVASGASEDEIIEKIDIGGISLIRAAAKNYKDVVIASSKSDYAPLLDILRQKGAETTQEERRAFATRAFNTTSSYDTAIHAWFERG